MYYRKWFEVGLGVVFFFEGEYVLLMKFIEGFVFGFLFLGLDNKVKFGVL